MTKKCNWCNEDFNSKSKNQIYCSSDCRSESTKKKVVSRYQLNKAKNRIGKHRLCAGGCNASLSIYNNSNFCDSCLINKKKVEKFIKELKGFFDYEQK